MIPSRFFVPLVPLFAVIGLAPGQGPAQKPVPTLVLLLDTFRLLEGPTERVGDVYRVRVLDWFIFGDEDHNIPVGAHRIMAERAGAKRTLEIAGASHAVAVSHAAETATLILEAARSRTPVEA